MMRDVLAKYVVVAHVAVLAAFLAWIHGGTRVEYLGAVPWLSLAVLEMTLILPPPRRDETLEQARVRVWRKIVWDPLLYIGLALCVYLLFQAMNGGRTLAFDVESNVWAFLPPPVGWGPFCIDPNEARQMLYWFVPASAAVLGIRHGMNRRGKLILLRLLALNGGCLALFGIVQNLSGSHRMFWMTPMNDAFFASFGYAGHAGAFFTLMFAANGGLFVHALMLEAERRHAIWLGITLALNLMGALLSLSCIAIVCSLAMLVLGGVYAMRHAWMQVSAGVRLKACSIFAVAMLLGSGFLFFALPDNPVLHRLQTMTWTSLNGLHEGRPPLSSAWSIWKDYPWFGVGGWGYRHYVGLYLNDVQRAQIQAGAANVGCDPLQFLAEHGAVGAGLMLGALAVLLFPIGRRLWFAHTTPVGGWTGERWLLLRISPLTVMLLAGIGVILASGLVDLPFRSPAVLVLWTIALACAPAFLPARPAVMESTAGRGRQGGGETAATQTE